MKMIYNVKDKPTFGKLIVFAFQQLLAIMAATIAVPMIVGNGMSTSAALFGAGIGTLVYVAFTLAKSPVFLGSSFAFLGSMATAFAGAATVELGYVGLICGAVFAGFVYVVIALIIKGVGAKWINKIMPAVVIGPTVAIIGLSLAGNAVGDLQTSNVEGGSPYVAIICGLVTLAVVMLCSVYGKKMGKLIPFIIGILAGYACATVFYFIGKASGNTALMVIDYSALVNNFSQITVNSFISVPDFTFFKAFGAFDQVNASYIGTIAVAYVPVAMVVFAEHVADHKNLSSIIEKDLLYVPTKEDKASKKDVGPGLHRTLLGDGIGSMVGAFFGGCPNTTYGESVGCVAITKNASVATITTTAIISMLISFVSPFVAFLDSIPGCVMGGVCITLYGFIAVSGLKMIQKVDLEDNANLFTTAAILIPGIGGMAMAIGKVTITAIACALILGIITNIVLNRKKADTEE